MSSYQKLVHNAINWDLIQSRLQNNSAINKHFPVEILKSCNNSLPFNCHYMSWRLGTWGDESFFQYLDHLLSVAAKIPNWDQEFKSYQRDCDFSNFWSLLWQLQVADFFNKGGAKLSWNVKGPDLTVVTEEGSFYVECYSFRKSFGIKEFISELFSYVDKNIRVEHRSYLPLSIPQNDSARDFLDELFSPYTDPHFLESQRVKAQRHWPVLLPVPVNTNNLYVYLEGESIESYDPGIIRNACGIPENYISDAIGKSADKNGSLNIFPTDHPSVLAINFLLNPDFQTAISRQFELFGTVPDINSFGKLDAIFMSVTGINEDVKRYKADFKEDGHPLLKWLQKTANNGVDHDAANTVTQVTP
jgi:hypothetical protein